MRQLAGLIGGELLSVDPLMNTIPTRMVSRVRRDTRYTNDKSLYRDNMWIMFMRPKNEWRGYPCMWFEVTQSAYSLGVGLYGSEAGLMQVFRKALRERGDEFLAAAAKCKKAGAVLSASTYKRMPPDCLKGLEEFYGCKEMYFIKFSGALDDLGDDRIIKIMRDTYKLIRRCINSCSAFRTNILKRSKSMDLSRFKSGSDIRATPSATKATRSI